MIDIVSNLSPLCGQGPLIFSLPRPHCVLSSVEPPVTDTTLNPIILLSQRMKDSPHLRPFTSTEVKSLSVST